MRHCAHCGEYAVGSSPTGAWCNSCDWADPCECWTAVKPKCKFHKAKATPTFDVYLKKKVARWRKKEKSK